MLTFKIFNDFIKSWKSFDAGIERFSYAISGKSSYGSDLYESDWFISVEEMLDCFLRSNFTEDGCSLIYWWLFDSVDKVISEITDTQECEINVDKLKDLWNYMKNNKGDYFLE